MSSEEGDRPSGQALPAGELLAPTVRFPFQACRICALRSQLLCSGSRSILFYFQNFIYYYYFKITL